MRSADRLAVLFLAPLFAFAAAFFVLPLAELVLVAGSGPNGAFEYLAILANPRHVQTLVATLALSAGVTVATLALGTVVALFLARTRFAGRALLVSALTLPLAFPGVVVGFMIILLAGRQGLLGAFTQSLGMDRLVFAYSMAGLFAGYLYFSLPRVLVTLMAAAEKLDPALEEAARSLGASRLAVLRDVTLPGLSPALIASGAIAFATAMGAFGTAFTLATRIDVLAMTIYTEFTLNANFATASALSLALGLITWGVLALTRNMAGTGVAAAGSAMIPHRLTFVLQLLVTLACAAFLLVPALASMLAGVTANYFQGLRSGLTLRWIGEVLALYSGTIGLSIAIALGTLGVTLVLGVPAAWALARKPSRLSRLVEEVVTLPVAIPGLALALALILAYGGFRAFRMSPLFILVGHVLYTLPFMLRAVMAVLAAVDVKALEEGAASLGASPLQRFFHVVVPNAKGGILAGALMVVTLSIGEFNLTWMLHTPLTKTLPVGLADSYASMRLEIASAYTLIFFVLIVPLLVALQMFGRALPAAPAKGGRP